MAILKWSQFVNSPWYTLCIVHRLSVTGQGNLRLSLSLMETTTQSLQEVSSTRPRKWACPLLGCLSLLASKCLWHFFSFPYPIKRQHNYTAGQIKVLHKPQAQLQREKSQQRIRRSLVTEQAVLGYIEPAFSPVRCLSKPNIHPQATRCDHGEILLIDSCSPTFQ